MWQPLLGPSNTCLFGQIMQNNLFCLGLLAEDRSKGQLQFSSKHAFQQTNQNVRTNRNSKLLEVITCVCPAGLIVKASGKARQNKELYPEH